MPTPPTPTGDPSSCRQVSLTALPGIPMVQPGDDIAQLILDGLARAAIRLMEGDILVVAHKIVSKAQGRLIRLSEVVPSERAIELAEITGKEPRYIQVVLDEARRVERARRGVIVTEHQDGWVAANSAIDQSNVESQEGEACALLLPLDPDGWARGLRARLQEATGATVAVIVNDTHGRPFRLGAVGVAIGVAGIEPLADLRGEPDLFGYRMQSSEIATADEIASAASMIQGQTAQGTPVVHVRGLPFRAVEGASAQALQRPRHLDMFR